MADVNRLSRVGKVNAYLVSEDDGLTVIDTMIGGSAGEIIAAAESSGALWSASSPSTPTATTSVRSTR
jgi:predicted regulator of Ras-like GTPase activity (Roadblock/LC7/MglB family)